MIGGFAILCDDLADRWHRGFVYAYTRSYRTDLIVRFNSGEVPGAVFFAAHKPYPFSGSHQQVPVCRTLTETNFRAFLAYLHDRDVGWVVVATSDPSWAGHITRIRGWVEERADIFERETADAAYVLYRVNRGALDQELAGQ